jgi:galactose oxidase-like protein
MYHKAKVNVAVLIAALLIGAPALMRAEGFQQYPDMPQARVGHSATLLANGEVLVVGGVADGSDGKSVALFSPVARCGYWCTANPANEARWHHTAISMPHGTVLVAGGSDPSTLTCSATAEIFSVSTSTFSYTASMSEPRQFHTATRLPGGKILVTGGVGDDSIAKASAEIYDPVIATWSLTDSMNTARARHSATLLRNGQVLVTGGDSGDGQTFYSSAELYDPATGTWSYTDDMSFLGQSSATLLQRGDVLVANGAHAALYRPQRGQFIRPGIPYSNYGEERLTLLQDGRVLMSGGKNTDGSYSNWWQLYDPSVRSWVIFPSNPMNYAHSGHTSTRLLDGTVLICGGLGYDGHPEAGTDVFFPY